jgi:hypothetical protein
MASNTFKSVQVKVDGYGTCDYIAGSDLGVQIGDRVAVPWGVQRREGVVVSDNIPSFDGGLKQVTERLDSPVVEVEDIVGDIVTVRRPKFPSFPTGTKDHNIWLSIRDMCSEPCDGASTDRVEPVTGYMAARLSNDAAYEVAHALLDLIED